MRRPLSLALLLVALSALPAAARDSIHVSFGFHPHFVRHFPIISYRFREARYFAPFGWGWGLADWDNWGGAPWGGPGTVIVLAGTPPVAYAPPPPPAQATVETEAGVTVFRGPGSHHVR